MCIFINNCDVLTTILHLECPDGFTALEGDIPGQGLTEYYNASLETCSDDCNDYQNVTIDEMNNCHSFEHSEEGSYVS